MSNPPTASQTLAEKYKPFGSERKGRLLLIAIPIAVPRSRLPPLLTLTSQFPQEDGKRAGGHLHRQ